LVQAALLFDHPNPVHLDPLIASFVTAAAKIGVRYKPIETNPGRFHRLYGDGVMITVEYVGGPAKPRLFDVALSTAFTRLTNPDARGLIARHQSHILVNVHHGVIPPNPATAAFLAKIDTSGAFQVGQTLDHFRERLSLCATLSRLIHSVGKASLVHWTTSDQLPLGHVFDKLATGEVPNLLHIHPLLANCGKNAEGRDQVDIKTFGAKYFVGREIHVAPNPLPWQESLGLIFTFLKIATMKHGYVIPDGDTFGDDERSLSCRVRYIPEDPAGPLYRLELLFSRKHGFVSADYVAPARTFDDRTVPADILSDLGRERFPVVEDMRATRHMAERIGGRLEVSETVPPRNAWSMPRVFGRKRPQGDA
jgi:hypothetical protein